MTIPLRRAAAALLSALLLAAIRPAHPLAAAEGAPPGDVLRDLVREALERNSDLNAVRSAAEARAERVLPAGALPDPMLSLMLSNVPVDDFSLSKDPMTSKGIGFTQAIPFPGKLSLKEEVARLDAVQASDRVESVRNAVRFKVKRDFFLLMENREVARLTEKNKALLQELLAAANTRYAVGKAPQQDLFKAQVEISRMERMLISLRKKDVELLADLNTLRSRPVDTPVEIPSSYPMPEMPYGEPELLGIARSSNPDLKGQTDATFQKETGLKLARKQILPDFQVGAQYMNRDYMDMPDMVTAQVMISVPLWHGRKQDKEVEASIRDVSAARSGYQNAWNAVQNRVREITADIGALRESLSLFDTGLLPQARESVSASLAAYEVGQVEFASVLMGQMSLYQQEIDRERTAEGLRIRAAELELVVGKELFENEGNAR
ncbi:MAG: TolC family protein [Gemmatimonadota bacterium]